MPGTECLPNTYEIEDFATDVHAFSSPLGGCAVESTRIGFIVFVSRSQ